MNKDGYIHCIKPKSVIINILVFIRDKKQGEIKSMINLSVRELITASAGLIGIIQQGEVLSSDDINLGLQTLDILLDEWSTLSLAVYSYSPTRFTLIPGQQIYTLGTGGDFDIERPMNIQQAYINYPQGSGNEVDLEINSLNDAEWASIKVKNVSSPIPTHYYSSGNYPLTNVYLWPIPSQTVDITLWLWSPLAVYATLDDPINLPPGYTKAIIYNLAVELAPRFGKELTEVISNTAMSSFARIRALNAVPQIMSIAPGLNGKRNYFNYLIGDTCG